MLQRIAPPRAAQSGIETADAWNHLISSSTTTHSYDALGQRITDVKSGTTTHLYLSDQWQVVEEVDGSTTRRQNVWSPVYVDAMVERDRDADANGSLEERLYPTTDANYNVTAITDASGDVVERYTYTPYGQPWFRDASWDQKSSGTGDYKWIYLHQGGRLDASSSTINSGDSSVYYFRNRDYHPFLGRWLQPDPIGYPDGGNRYEMERSGVVGGLDPWGLTWYNPTTWLVPLGEAAGDLGGHALYGNDYQNAIDASVSGTPQAQAAARQQLERTIENARIVTEAVTGLPGTSLGGPIGSPTGPASTFVADQFRAAANAMRWAEAEAAETAAKAARACEAVDAARAANAARAAENVAAGAKAADTTAAATAGQYVNLASGDRTIHTLYGDATGGGHLFPGLPRKTPFPESWSSPQIMNAISDVATDPLSVTSPGRFGRTIVTGTRSGVDIQVILESPARGGGIVSGYPTNLPRNP